MVEEARTVRVRLRTRFFTRFLALFTILIFYGFADNTLAEILRDTAGYSEQDHREHAYDVVHQASTLVINGQGDVDVSGEAAFVGTQVSGPGHLNLRAAGGIRLESVADVHEASSHTSGVSVAVNLPMAAAGDPLGFLGTGGGQNSRTYDYDSYVDQGAAGIQMEGGQTLDGAVTVINPSEVHIHTEESIIPLSLVRLASAGYQNTQAVLGLMQTLSPPAERFQSELYMALEEEGITPEESAQIIEDPVLQRAIRDIDEAAAEIQQVAKTVKLTQAVEGSSSSSANMPVDIMDLGLAVPDVPGMAQYLAKLRDPTPQEAELRGALTKTSSGIQGVKSYMAKLGDKHPRIAAMLEQLLDQGALVARAGFYMGSMVKGAAVGTEVHPVYGPPIGAAVGLVGAVVTEWSTGEAVTGAVHVAGTLAASQATTQAQAMEYYDSAGSLIGALTVLVPMGRKPVSLQLRSCLRHVELRTGLSVLPIQRSLLKEALQRDMFAKLDPEAYKAHTKKFTKDLRVELILQWQDKTKQKWPTIMKPNKETGILEPVFDHQVHHIIPQEVGGPHEWFNIHPAKGGTVHQAEIHGKKAPLTEILKYFK